MKSIRVIDLDKDCTPGEILKKIRVAKGLRPSEVARVTGMSCQRINDMEHGRCKGMTIGVAAAYCEAIGARISIITDIDE